LSARRRSPKPAAHPSRKLSEGWIAALLLAALAAAAYSSSFAAGFVLDNGFILENARLHDWTWPNLKLILTDNYWAPEYRSNLYRPLTTLTYAFNYCVLGNGADPTGYHALNLLLHWANSLLVFKLARRILGAFTPAVFAAALFALHPLGVEAVTNIVGRADLLAAFFVLTGVLLHLHLPAAGPRARRWCLAALGLVAALGMFSKENAVVLPALLLLADVCAGTRGSRARGAAYAVLLPAVALVAFARHAVLTDVASDAQVVVDNPILMAGFWTGRMTAVRVLGYYLALFLWPRHLSSDYSFNQIPLFTGTLSAGDDAHAWLALLLYAGFAALLWVRRRDKPLLYCGGFFLIALLPVANIVVLTGTIMAERLLYLPSVGLVGLMGLCGYRLYERVKPQTRVTRVLLTIPAMAVLVALGARTFLRNRDWRTEHALWTSAAASCPQSHRAWQFLAHALYAESGDARLDEAIELAERARSIVESGALPLEYRPRVLYQNLAVYYSQRAEKRERMGDADGARVSYERAAAVLRETVEIDRALPGVGTARAGRATRYVFLGKTYVVLGRWDEALEALGEALSLVPDDPAAWYLAGVAQAGLGRFDEAAVSMVGAIVQGADFPELWSRLDAVYRRLSPDRPGILHEDGKSALADTPLVRRHVLAATHRLVQRLTAVGRRDDALRVRDLAVERAAADPRYFDDVLGATIAGH
jgi:tetratricopeptide (TPR) repeat protein